MKQPRFTLRQLFIAMAWFSAAGLALRISQPQPRDYDWIRASQWKLAVILLIGAGIGSLFRRTLLGSFIALAIMGLYALLSALLF